MKKKWIFVLILSIHFNLNGQDTICYSRDLEAFAMRVEILDIVALDSKIAGQHYNVYRYYAKEVLWDLDFGKFYIRRDSSFLFSDYVPIFRFGLIAVLASKGKMNEGGTYIIPLSTYVQTYECLFATRFLEVNQNQRVIFRHDIDAAIIQGNLIGSMFDASYIDVNKSFRSFLVKDRNVNYLFEIDGLDCKDELKKKPALNKHFEEYWGQRFQSLLAMEQNIISFWKKE